VPNSEHSKPRSLLCVQIAKFNDIPGKKSIHNGKNLSRRKAPGKGRYHENKNSVFQPGRKKFPQENQTQLTMHKNTLILIHW
jgi:hypothetical protein